MTSVLMRRVWHARASIWRTHDNDDVRRAPPDLAAGHLPTSGSLARPGPGLTRTTLTTTATEADAAELWPVYDAVFGDQVDEATWRREVWDRHADRDGFRLARVYDDAGLAGFAYGYTGERGQWWTDRVAEVWPDDLAAQWLGGHFELVSIGVLETARGRGLGRQLMRLLLEGLPHDRLLLMTSADPADPARRLYVSEGWRSLGPGIGDGQVIMGRHIADSPKT